MQKDLFTEMFEATYTVINHDMVKKLDLVTAYWLCEILSWMKHLRNKKKLDENGWFYYTQSHMEEKIGVSSQRQNRIIKRLSSLGIINVERRGMPAKNYFKVNYDTLAFFLYGESLRSIKIIEHALSEQEIYYNSKKNIYPPNSKNGVGVLSSDFLRKQNIRPCFYRFALQIQKKQIENYPSQFKQHSSKQLEKQVAQGAEVLDKLVRLDNWDFKKEIKPAIEWGVEESDFWPDKILSLAQLRNKMKSNGNTKFTNLFNGWKSWKQDKEKKKKERKKFEDPNNPSRKFLKKGPDGRAIVVWEN